MLTLFHAINTLLVNNEIPELQEALAVILSSFPKWAPKNRTAKKYWLPTEKDYVAKYIERL